MKPYFLFNLGLILSLLFLNSDAAQTYHFEQKSFKEVNDKSYSTIKVSYPIFKNINQSEQLNSTIKNKIDKFILDFKNEIAQFQNEKQKENQPYKIKDLPLNVNSNTLDVRSKIKNNTNNIISILFNMGSFYYGSAHPSTNFESINYDVKEGKILTLDDLFKPNSNYLQILADYSQKVLTEKLTKAGSGFTKEAITPDPDGIKPVADNYKIWNITPHGLLITFPPYQVAAYVFGPQDVLIPYAKINHLMKVPK